MLNSKKKKSNNRYQIIHEMWSPYKKQSNPGCSYIGTNHCTWRSQYTQSLRIGSPYPLSLYCFNKNDECFLAPPTTTIGRAKWVRMDLPKSSDDDRVANRLEKITQPRSTYNDHQTYRCGHSGCRRWRVLAEERGRASRNGWLALAIPLPPPPPTQRAWKRNWRGEASEVSQAL